MKQLTLLIALSTLVGLGSGFSSPASAQYYYDDSSYAPYATYVNPYNNYGYQTTYRTAPIYRNRRYVRSYPSYSTRYYNNYGYRYNERRSGGRIAADILNQIF